MMVAREVNIKGAAKECGEKLFPLEFFRNRIDSHTFRIHLLHESYRSLTVHVPVFSLCSHVIFKLLCYPLIA